jgi:DNA polymerase-3 subunit beta
MKFTIARSDLLRCLAHVVPVADAKGTMPVLGNVHLKADPDKIMGCLELATSNLDITATTDVHASVDEDGEICLPARALQDRVKAMPEGEITFSLKGMTATLKAKSSARKFTLLGFPAEEFPQLPELEKPDWSHELPALELAGLIAATSFAISDDLTRMHLSSLLVEQVGSGLRAVSTDGHRLALAATHDGLPEKPDTTFLVPKGAVQRIKALIESGKDSVKLARVVNQSGASASLWVTNHLDDSLCCKLVDAQFPPYRQVIPDKSEIEATIDRRALLGATKAVAVASPNSLGIKFELSKGKLKLTAESPDDGEGVDELDCECQVKHPRTYGLNSRYLVEALDALLTDTVVLKASGELDPMTLEPVGASREQTVVLMPMRT